MTHVFNVAGEREALIPRECPNLATRRRDTSDCPNHGQEDQNRRHERRRCYRLCRIVQDLNDWDARLRRIRQPKHIVLPVWSQAETQRDQHH